MSDFFLGLTLMACLLGADRFQARELAQDALVRWDWTGWAALKLIELEGCPEARHRAKVILVRIAEPIGPPALAGEPEPDEFEPS